MKTDRGQNVTEIRLQIEVLLVRLIHLLAHHPDFSTDVEDLKTFSRYSYLYLSMPRSSFPVVISDICLASINCRYLEFFLDCVATKENVSLLYYLSLKVKTVRDARSSEYDSVSLPYLPIWFAAHLLTQVLLHADSP